MKILLLALLVGCSINIKRAHKSVASIITETNVGSGFFVSSNLVVTNAHVCRDNKFVAVNEDIAQVIKIDRNADLCLAQTTKPGIPVTLGSPAKPYDEVTVVSGRYLFDIVRGYVTNIEVKNDQTVSGSVDTGMSGSPVFNINNEVVGVVVRKIALTESYIHYRMIKIETLKKFLEGEIRTESKTRTFEYGIRSDK